MDTHPLWDVVLVPDAIGLRPFLLSMEDANHVLTLSGAATPPQSTSAEGCNACLHPEDRHHQHTCSKRRLITLQTPRRSSSRLRQLGDSNPSHAAGAHASAATLEPGNQLFDALSIADMLFSAVGYGAIEDRSAAQQHDRRSSSRQERSRAASRSRSISPARSWAHEEVAQEEEEGDPAALVSPLSTFTAPGGAGSLMCVSIPPQLLHCDTPAPSPAGVPLRSHTPSHVPSPHRQSSSPTSARSRSTSPELDPTDARKIRARAREWL